MTKKEIEKEFKDLYDSKFLDDEIGDHYYIDNFDECFEEYLNLYYVKVGNDEYKLC